MGKIRTRNQYQAEFVKCIQKFGGKYQTWEIFADFISMFACAISNGIDRVHFKPREEMYMQIIRKYTKEEQAIFPEMMGHVINGMEENRDCDFLGELYMALDLGSHWKGQFFTPYSLCKMTAQLQKNDIEQEIKANGFVSVNDPACGAGALLVAVANTAAEEIKQFNWQNHILFVAQDIDAVTAKMCYTQLSLLGCAGYVKIGDTMANPITANESLYEMTKEDSCYWYTPMYFNDVWNWRRMFHMFDKTMQKNITITNNDEKEKPAQPVENSQDIDRNEFNTEKNGQLSLF